MSAAVSANASRPSTGCAVATFYRRRRGSQVARLFDGKQEARQIALRRRLTCVRALGGEHENGRCPSQALDACRGKASG